MFISYTIKTRLVLRYFSFKQFGEWGKSHNIDFFIDDLKITDFSESTKNKYVRNFQPHLTYMSFNNFSI